jgi:hypothetical protein
VIPKESTSVVALALAFAFAFAFAVAFAFALALAVASEIGPGFSPGTKIHHNSNTALPKAVVKPEGRND